MAEFDPRLTSKPTFPPNPPLMESVGEVPSPPSVPANAPPISDLKNTPRNKKRFTPLLIILLAFVALVVGGVIFSLTLLGGKFDFISQLPFVNRFRAVRLVWWGWNQTVEVSESVIQAYQQQHPNVTIEYIQKTSPDLASYRENIIQRLQETSNSPDIVMLHQSWVIPLFNSLYPVPRDVYSLEEIESTFYPAVKDSLLVDSSYYALPVSYDGLVLYYNKDLFKEAGLDHPPQDWEEFSSVASRLTIKQGGDSRSSYTSQAGAAIGTAGNISHASDIYGLMLAQSNLQFPSDLTSAAAQDAITFFTSFSTKSGVWNANLVESVVAFSRGEVAMLFAPYWRQADFRDLAPELNYGIARVPQAPKFSTDTQEVAWASFWVEAVPKASANRIEAFRFIKFLTSQEGEKIWYQNSYNFNYPGELPSRRDLAGADWLPKGISTTVLEDAKWARFLPFSSCSGNDLLTLSFRDSLALANSSGSYAGLLSFQQKAQESVKNGTFVYDTEREICTSVYGGGLLALQTTPSPVATTVPTASPTPTVVVSPTVSATPTPSPTTLPTGGPSNTPTPTVSVTATNTPSPTITVSPTITATVSASPTVSSVPVTGFSTATRGTLVIGFLLVGVGLFLQLFSSY